MSGVRAQPNTRHSHPRVLPLGEAHSTSWQTGGRGPGRGVRPADPDRGVYGISVAAELTGLGVQTLRLYETRGLLEPDRTTGGTRRYSPNDLDRLRRIGTLLDAGLNLAGISMVFTLEQHNRDLEQQNRDLKERNSQLSQEKRRKNKRDPHRAR